jgi:hypothetical protein
MPFQGTSSAVVRTSTAETLRNVMAVGMALSSHPPHRPVQAGLPHTVLTSDVDLRTARWGKGAGSSAFGSHGRLSLENLVPYTARLYLCERFALPVAQQHASLEAEATG